MYRQRELSVQAVSSTFLKVCQNDNAGSEEGITYCWPIGGWEQGYSLGCRLQPYQQVTLKCKQWIFKGSLFSFLDFIYTCLLASFFYFVALCWSSHACSSCFWALKKHNYSNSFFPHFPFHCCHFWNETYTLRWNLVTVYSWKVTQARHIVFFPSPQPHSILTAWQLSYCTLGTYSGVEYNDSGMAWLYVQHSGEAVSWM